MTAATQASRAAGAVVEPAAVLDVERSVSGRRWQLREAPARTVAALCEALEISEILARALAARGVGPEEADAFLNPTLRALLPDPSHLLDLDAAAERLAAAVTAGETIGIFGDYDVDGATSSALLIRFLRKIGASTAVHIPDRAKEGYGPNLPALAGLKAQGARLVVTVDCGTTAFEALDGAHRVGIEVIVVDHHLAEARLPVAAALINPNRIDENSPHRQLAAVGVTFLLVVAVNRALRARGWYRSRPEPDLLEWLDLVALGTVADVVPLTGINRALVAQGLKVMAQRRNTGLAALADVARLDSRPTAYHLGYILGPRVNAGGRVGQSDLGVRLLSTDDPDEAAALAVRLHELNRERQEIEAAVLDAALERVEARGIGNAPLVFAAGEGWHQGVIGIVASRLKERYGRPAAAIAIEGEIAKGSCRSIPGIDMGAAITAARQAGLLINGGGHAMAAGFTAETARLAALAEFLMERLGERTAEAIERAGRLSLEAVLAPEGATMALAHEFEQLGPFGAGNAEPRLALAHVGVVRPEVVGNGHVRCLVTGNGGARLKAIAFRSASEPLGTALLASPHGTAFHLAGRLRLNQWQAREEVELHIDDAAPSRGDFRGPDL
ncbi:MAG: single-stranded-DNA-specific exonuclease RecJ [Alphaproteobacteria bacterium]